MSRSDLDLSLLDLELLDLFVWV